MGQKIFKRITTKIYSTRFIMKKKKPEDDLEHLFDEEPEVKCRHCGGSYVLEDGFDENYCSEECFKADTEE